MKLCLSLMLVAGVALSVSTSRANPTNQECVDRCNKIYTPKWQDCRGVKQCEAFVERVALICIRHCQE